VHYSSEISMKLAKSVGQMGDGRVFGQRKAGLGQDNDTE